MSIAQSIIHFDRESADVRVRIATDPAGRGVTPPLPAPRVAVHMGRSIYMRCERAGLKHHGWDVHGDIHIVPAGTPAIWEPDGPDTALIVTMDPHLLERTIEGFGLNAKPVELLNRFQVRDPQIEHICWALKSELEAGYPTGRIFFDSLTTALAAALVQRHSSYAAIPFPSNKSMSGCRFRNAVSYIEDNLGKDLSLAEIADVVGLSVSHLKTTFRQMTGVPVHQYVIQRRVERAAALLSQGTLSVREVARQAGFAHQSHMAKHMRRVLGHSPKAFRPSGMSIIGQ